MVIKKNMQPDILTIAGGGDTISVIKMAKAQDGFSYISKAGGAFLEWLEGKSSPGVEALKNNEIINFFKKVEKMGADYFYLADSFGNCSPKNLLFPYSFKGMALSFIL